MPLVVELKPNERVIVGDALITNGAHRAKFTIQGDAPVLRERDVLTPQDAMSPARRIYYTLQVMYLDGEDGLVKHHKTLQTLLSDYAEAAPSALPIIDEIGKQILSENLYSALKVAKSLMTHEEERIGHAPSHLSLRPDR